MNSYSILYYFTISTIIFTFSYINSSNYFTYGQQHQSSQKIILPEVKIYSDPKGNYTLQYPQSWNVQYQKSFVKFGYPTTQFILPDHVSIVSISMTNTELDEKRFKSGFLIFYPLILQERFKNSIEIENKTLGSYNIDGHQAGSIIFTNFVDNSLGIVKGLFIAAVPENNKIISITYISSQKNFQNNIKDIEDLVKSIKIFTERLQ